MDALQSKAPIAFHEIVEDRLDGPFSRELTSGESLQVLHELRYQIRKQYPGRAAPGDKVIKVLSDEDMKL
ncbi:hypothetical protein [Bradyrhizobium sp. th.b2]|uniref:hypothetical protein n=1 Tax=Bradyrhizobium sp. th-b2 TaxID=172088 RepID=UPI00042A427C|nr:hypothetical protein [Bradyrhizobium sp. th.b2]